MNKNNQHIHNLEMLFNHIKYVSNSDFDLDDIEFKSSLFVDTTVSQLTNFSDSKQEVILSVERMRKTISVLLISIDKGFEKSLVKIDDIYNKIEDIQKFKTKHPIYVNVNDPEEGKRFLKKLIKEEYNYTKSGELLGLTRQTISKLVKENRFGVMKTGSKKILSKEQLYIFYIKRLTVEKRK